MTKREVRLLVSAALITTIPTLTLVALLQKFNTTTSMGLIQTCGQILNDITQHIHLNLQSLPVFVIKSIAGISLTLLLPRVIILIKYSIDHNRYQSESTTVANLLPTYKDTKIGNIHIKIINSHKKTAYATGWLKPFIVISNSLIADLPTKQLEAVVLHEAYHSTHSHALIVAISRLMKSILFFFPIAGTVLDRLKLEFEIAADAFVIQTQQTNRHISYALANNLETTSTFNPGINTHPLEHRINAIITGRKTYVSISRNRIISSMIVLVIGFGLLLSSPPNTSAINPEESSYCRASQCLTNCDDVQEPGFHHDPTFSPNTPASYSFSFSY